MGKTTAVGIGRDSKTGDSDEVIRDARRGCGTSRWRVLADCQDYLRLVVRQGNWSKATGGARTSDLIQRTIVDAWRKFSGFRGSNDRELRGWVRMILINAAKKDWRNAKPVAPDAARKVVELPDRGPTPDEAVEDSEQIRRMDAALAALKPRDQAIIRLRIWDGLSFVEIGHVIGMTEDAARMYFSRALDRLRRQMRLADGIG